MTIEINHQDQQHPQENSDRAIINQLLAADPNDYNLAELARLRIRYRNFPGARAIQQDLEKLLQQWNLSEAQLFEQTRQIHSKGKVYLKQSQGDEQQDWKTDIDSSNS